MHFKIFPLDSCYVIPFSLDSPTSIISFLLVFFIFFCSLFSWTPSLLSNKLLLCYCCPFISLCKIPTPTIEGGLSNHRVCQKLNMDVIGGGRNALEVEWSILVHVSFEKSMYEYFWKLELLFLAFLVTFVSILLATLYVTPHQQYTLLCFEKSDWYTTMQTMPKQGCKINEIMLQTTALFYYVSKYSVSI